MIKLQQSAPHLTSLLTHLFSGIEKQSATDEYNQDRRDPTLIARFERKSAPEKSKDISEAKAQNEGGQHAQQAYKNPHDYHQYFKNDDAL